MTIVADFKSRQGQTKGLLERLTPEQRSQLFAFAFAFKGHEAGGDQTLPKRAATQASRIEALSKRPEGLTPEEFAAYNLVNGLDK